MKVKNKIKASVHLLKFPVFGVYLKVIICDNLYKVGNKLNLIEGVEKDFVKDCDALTSGWIEKGYGFIMIKPDCGIEAISHEANHFVNILFNHIGQHLDIDNDEVKCYHLGYTSKKIKKYIKKHKKHFKNN